MPLNQRFGRSLVLALAVFAAAPAVALEIRDLEITREGDRYRVNFDVLVPVQIGRAHV